MRLLLAALALIGVSATLYVWTLLAVWAGHVVLLPPYAPEEAGEFWSWLAIIWAPPILSIFAIRQLLKLRREFEHD